MCSGLFLAWIYFHVETRIIRPEIGARIDREEARHDANLKEWKKNCSDEDSLALASKELSDEIDKLSHDKYNLELSLKEGAPVAGKIKELDNRIKALREKLEVVDGQYKRAFLARQKSQSGPAYLGQ